MSLVTTTENQFHTKITDFENQFLNISYSINDLIINHVGTILPYLALVSIILGFLSCFLPCILCKTIKEILLLPCRCLRCVICNGIPFKSHNKASPLKQPILQIAEVKNDKEQEIIAV